MRKPAILLPLLLSHALAGCLDGEPSLEPDAPVDPDGPDGPDTPGAKTLDLRFTAAPALVAFRDGLDAPWQAATKTSELTYQAAVHGPYLLAVVCDAQVLGYAFMVQEALVPEDELDLAEACAPPVSAPEPHELSGSMAQPGVVHVAGRTLRSANHDWGFTFHLPAGLADLFAISADRIVRQVITVDHDIELAPLDTAGGSPLADVAFTAANATPAETVSAVVSLDIPSTDGLVPVYSGPSGGAKAVSDAVLGTADEQYVSIRAVDGGSFRALRRPFRVGGVTSSTLPAPIEAPRFQVEGGRLAASWSALPPLTYFQLSAASDSEPYVSHFVVMSPRFVAATGLSQIALDTDIPGFLPEWKLDTTRAHQRMLMAQHVASGEVATSQFVEDFDPSAPAALAPSGGQAWDAPGSLQGSVRAGARPW